MFGVTEPSNTVSIKVRPISFEEIQALAQADAPPLEAYQVRTHPTVGDVLVATTYTPEPKVKSAGGTEIPHQTIYESVPDTRPAREGSFRADAESPVGHKVKLTSETQFGSQSGIVLYTTLEAEQSVTLMGAFGYRSPQDARRGVAVPDDEGVEIPLMPIYGSQMNTSVIVKGVEPDEMTSRVEKALRAEFGDEVKIQKLKARPVADIRVNVFEIADDQPIAFNVLEAEAAPYAGGRHHRVEYVQPGVVIGE